jgi:CDP-glucose 4,6-dehydratase
MLNGKFGNMTEELKNIYSGKKVFLTGHTGFKGAWMLKLLSMLGAEVKGYALEPKTSEDLFYLIKGNEICHSVIADLRNKEVLEKEIVDFQPDFIFHLAAQPLVRVSYEIPAETFDVNVIGTANVLDGARQLKKSCTIVLITTDKVYHNNEWEYPYRENDRLGGYDPYSASKACCEILISSYRNSFFNPKDYNSHKKSLVVARAGNVIGGGDWSEDRLIPDFVKALMNNKPVILRNPNAVRPWQHVLEPITGYLLLGAKLYNTPLGYSEAYNLGPNTSDTFPVVDMVKYAIESFGSGTYEIFSTDNQPHEAGLLKLDISKIIAETRWMPKLNAENAVKLTIDWYKAFINKGEMNLFTEEQIKSFLVYGQ